jgi:hypothetical protein
MFKIFKLALSPKVTANGRGYETCRIAEMRPYPTIQNLMRDETLANPLKPACFMTRCWRYVLYFPFNSGICLIKSINDTQRFGGI